MRISTLIYTIKQGFINIVRNKMFSLASILTMSTCIFMFGLFFSLITNFQHNVKSAEDGVAITVLFDDEIPQESIDYIGAQIKTRDDVSRIEYTSPEQAWESFKEDYFGEENAAAAEGFKDDNPLANSASYAVYMKDISTQADLVTYIERLNGVRKVNKSDMVAQTLSTMNLVIGYASITIIMILLLISVFLISNTVTIGINVRREEIGIMKYIGAKDGFVRAPFIIEGLMIGFTGAAIPLLILYLSYERVITYVLDKFTILSNILTFLSVDEVYRTLLPAGLLLGVGIGFLGSALTIRKHLKV